MELNTEINIENEEMPYDVINDSKDFHQTETTTPQGRNDSNFALLRRHLKNEHVEEKLETFEDIQETPLIMIKEECIYEPESNEQQLFQHVVCGSTNAIKVEEPETNPEDVVLKSEPNDEQVFVESASHFRSDLSALNEISAELEMLPKRDVSSQNFQQFVCIFCFTHLKSEVELKNHLLVFHSSLR